MKKLLMVIPMVFLLCFTFSCQEGEEVAKEPEPVVDVEADIAAIKDFVKEWNEAFNSLDINKLMTFYTDNSVRIPTNKPPLIGKEAIRGDFQRFFDQFTPEQQAIVHDVQVSGDLAFARGIWANLVTFKDGVITIRFSGSWVDIYQKQTDGSWKSICNIWSDKSLVSPPPEKE